jgi:hypothetical protein
MKKTHHVVCILLFLFSENAIAQFFQYRYSNMSTFTKVIETHDHGFLLVGRNTAAAMELMRIDSVGNVQWANTYSGGACTILDMVELPDSSFLLTGYCRDNVMNYVAICLIKINQYGDPIFFKVANNSLLISDGVKLILHNNNRVTLVAVLSRPGWINIGLVNMDSNGSVSSVKLLDSANTYGYLWDNFFSIRSLDGNIIIGVNISYNSIQRSNLILKTDTSGSIFWQKETDIVDCEYMNGLAETTANDIIFSSSFDGCTPNHLSGSIITSLDSLGNLNWSKHLDEGFFRSITSVGNKIIASGATFYPSTINGLTTKIDFSGNIDQTILLPNTNNFWNTISTHDGCIMSVANFGYQNWCGKYDTTFNLSCDSSILINTQSYGRQITNQNLSFQDWNCSFSDSLIVSVIKNAVPFAVCNATPGVNELNPELPISFANHKLLCSESLNFRFQIYSLDSKLVFEEESMNKSFIDLPSLPAGVYIYCVSAKNYKTKHGKLYID